MRAYLIVILFVVLFGFGAERASAEKRYFYNPDGFRCELTTEDTLAKGVCRNPRQFSDYYLVFIEINRDMNRVFVDYLYPISGYNDFMEIRRENMTIERFYAIYGR